MIGKVNILQFVGICLILISSNSVFGEAIPPEIGSIRIFYSENGEYSLSIKILGYPDESPSECTFKKGDSTVWSKEIPTTPGIVNISDNGKTIVMANWGWYDEAGFKTLSFYNDKGELVREANPCDKSIGLLWIDHTAISPDGAYFIFDASGKYGPELYLYEFKTGNLVWKKRYGFYRIVEIEISNGGNSILVAAVLNGISTHMLFVLLDRDGNSIWQTSIDNNFSWSTNDYLHLNNNGESFEIFDKVSGKYISYTNVDGKISLLSDLAPK